MARATLFHQMHDLGLAAWFGGTLANAVALNPAASAGGYSSRVGAVANEGWNRWTPVNAAAIGVHLIGAAGLLKHDLGRTAAQKGVPTMAITKTVLTAAALGVTADSRVLGKKVSEHHAVPASDGTTPNAATPPEVAKAQKQQRGTVFSVTPVVVGHQPRLNVLVTNNGRVATLAYDLSGNIVRSQK